MNINDIGCRPYGWPRPWWWSVYPRDTPTVYSFQVFVNNHFADSKPRLPVTFVRNPVYKVSFPHNFSFLKFAEITHRHVFGGSRRTRWLWLQLQHSGSFTKGSGSRRSKCRQNKRTRNDCSSKNISTVSWITLLLFLKQVFWRRKDLFYTQKTHV